MKLSQWSLVAVVVLAGCGPTTPKGPTCPAPQAECDGTCRDLAVDPRHCGACGQACAAGEVCSNGACATSCQVGLVACGGACVDPKSSRAFCGASGDCAGSNAGTACAAGEVCSDGACATSCQAGLLACGGTCVDPKSSRAFCGASGDCAGSNAGTACAAGEVCSDGACATSCQAGLLACGGACVDPKSSRAFCGASGDCAGANAGAACASGEVCSDGACATSCQAGLLVCGGLCTDPQTSRTHCGATGDCAGGHAGATCAPGELCSNGACAPSCPAGQVACGGTCVNPQTDPAWCGAAAPCTGTTAGAVCASGEVCANGACALSCPGGQLACSGSCVDPLTSRTHCGAHADCAGANAGAVCVAGEVCANGACAASCPPGQVVCGGTCVEPKSNRTFCGASADCAGVNAGTSCAAGQVCANGACALSCPTGLLDCGGTCIDPKTSVTACGASLDCAGAHAGALCAAGEACVAGACVPLCAAGLTSCGVPGTAPVCSDLLADTANCGACGTACGAGLSCIAGACRFGFKVDTDLSVTRTDGKACADGGDMVRYPVVGLTSTTATLSAAPSANCLAAGDQVLLINLQGAPGQTLNVGRFERLTVASVSAETVTFSAPKVNSYGAGAGDDTGLGLTAADQRVMLQRVPAYPELLVAPGATVTAAAWDGKTGGVLAFDSSGPVEVKGTLTMAGRGYRGAASTATASTTGTQGEGPGGTGVADVHNSNGAGGGGSGDGQGCATFGSAGGGGGHGAWGQRGSTPCAGAGGDAYGAPTLARIFMGAGGASGGTDNALANNPPGGAGGNGGGIILVRAPSARVTGLLSAAGAPGVGDTSTTCNPGSTTSCWDFSGPGGGGAGGTLQVVGTLLGARSTLSVVGGAGGQGVPGGPAGNGGAGATGRMLPLPVTCADLPPAAGDGEHLFAFAGDVARPFRAWCTGVGTAAPKMYLTLLQRGAGQNFSRYDATRLDAENGSSTVTTVWQRVRFDPLTRVVDGSDFTFSSSTGAVLGGPGVFSQMPYAQAGDCACGGPLGSANVDLRGLPFAVEQGSANWLASGAGQSGSATASSADRKVDIVGGGCCGAIAPTTANGNLVLVYAALPEAQSRSCAEVKAADATAGDRLYAVTPSPALPLVPVACDMTTDGGGWTLLQDTGAGTGPNNLLTTVPVVPGVASALPMSVMRALAATATQVHLRTTGQAATASFTTTASSVPVQNLQKGQLLNQPGTPWALTDYTGPLATNATLGFSCAPARNAWPDVYHACGNANGLHLVDTASAWDVTLPSGPMQVWAR